MLLLFHIVWSESYASHYSTYPGSKVHEGDMGDIQGRQGWGGPNVSPINFAISVYVLAQQQNSEFSETAKLQKKNSYFSNINFYFVNSFTQYTDPCNFLNKPAFVSQPSMLVVTMDSLTLHYSNLSIQSTTVVIAIM